MTIRLTLEAHELENPAVASAVARLLLQIGESYARRVPAAPAADVVPAAPLASHAAPAPAAPPGYAEFEAGLSGNTLRFLQLLRTHGSLTLSQAMEALDLETPKALGGITGAIGRWAPVRGLAVPYEVVQSPGGERAWRWTGPAVASATPVAPVEALPAPRAPAPARRPRPAATPKPAPAKPVIDPEALRAKLVESLADQPRRFMDFLRDKRQATTTEVITHLGLARAKALSAVLERIGQAASQLGLETAYETSATATGERVYLWPGTTMIEEEPRPRAEAPTPRVLSFQSAALRPDAPTSAGAPGVFKRSRRLAR
jgi:hypothetical protein